LAATGPNPASGAQSRSCNAVILDDFAQALFSAVTL